MKRKLLAVILAVCVISVFGLAACGGDESALDRIAKADELVVYTNAEFQPYEYLGPNGEIIGVDMEIAQAIADELGVQLKVENAAFDGLVASISSGKGDLGIAAMTITPERKDAVLFSIPYVDAIQFMVIPEDSSYTYIEDLAGLTLGSQAGTTGQLLVDDEISKGVLKDTNTEMKPYTSGPIAMEDLKAGRIAAVVIDEEVAKQLAEQNDGYKAVAVEYKSGEPLTEQYGIFAKKGSEDLIEVVNKVLEKILAENKIEQWTEEYSLSEE
jgi:polar amino acid transport system substrate-binding protein